MVTCSRCPREEYAQEEGRDGHSQYHSWGSRAGEGNERPVCLREVPRNMPEELNGMRGVQRTRLVKGLATDMITAAPGKEASTPRRHRLVCLHLIPYLRELGTIQARIKPGADASHTVSPAIACFHHGHESASYHE